MLQDMLQVRLTARGLSYILLNAKPGPGLFFGELLSKRFRQSFKLLNCPPPVSVCMGETVGSGCDREAVSRNRSTGGHVRAAQIKWISSPVLCPMPLEI